MKITFESKLIKINNHTIFKLPLSCSQMLSSRGIVMVNGVINNIVFNQVLEPDGKGSHFITVSPMLIKQISKDVKNSLSISLEQSKVWIEPEVSNDIIEAITLKNALDYWDTITPKARWDWLRWINSTQNQNTRNKRINVTISKLKQGDKNPCCFDVTRCTIADISKSGILHEF